MNTKCKVASVLCILILTVPPALNMTGAATQGVLLELTTDAATVHAWGSCLLSAKLTRDGAPLANVSVTWQAAAGAMETNSSTTDQAGVAHAQFTAVVPVTHALPAQVQIGAQATVDGTDYTAKTNLSIDPYPVNWTGVAAGHGSAGQLCPGELLYINVDIEQPANVQCNPAANLTVEAAIYDSADNLVNTITLGKGLDLVPGMKWSSGNMVLFEVPQNPSTTGYNWTFMVLSPHGTWTYFQPQNMTPLRVLTATKDSWTYLIYLDGDNSLTNWTRDYINALEVVAPSGQFTVLIQWDVPHNPTTRWRLAWDLDQNVVHSVLLGTLPNVDSGNWQTLLAFLRWGADVAPAGHYLVSIWDHGGGYYGTCWDDSSWTNLPNQNLLLALEDFKETHRRTDILVLDVCLQSSLEAAIMFRGVADYILACEVVLKYDILTPVVFTKLKTYYPANPIAPQVVQDIIWGFRHTNGDAQPIAALDLKAAHQVNLLLDTVAKTLLKKWPAVKKWVRQAWESSPPAGGDLPEHSTLVDAKRYFQMLRSYLAWAQPALLEQQLALDALLASIDSLIIDRVPFGSFTGVHLFFAPSTGSYKTEKPAYLGGGLPETHGWVQVMERLYIPAQAAKPGTSTYYPQVQGFSNYEVASGGMFASDSDHDGRYESVAVDITVNQSGNARPVMVVLDLVGFNGTKAANYQSLSDRKVFTVAAGTQAANNLTLTSPVEDDAEVVLTVLADDGTPVQRVGLGRVWMNPTGRPGPALNLNITASATAVTEGRAINFTATTASDQNITYWWDFDDHNGVGIDATGRSASTSYRGGWNRTVTCIASGGGNLEVRTMEMAVAPDTADRQPVANLTALFLDPALPMKVTLNASRTSDPDGEPVEYLFDFGDENLTGWGLVALAEHEYAAPGNYDCVVMVRDHTAYNGSMAAVTVQPGTTPVTLPPAARLVLSAAKVRAGKAMTADSSGSSDPGGSALEFRIDWGDGNVTGWTASANVSHNYARAGNYTVKLTVRNKWDLAASASSTVVVTPKPKPPAKGFIPGMMVAPALAALVVAAVAARLRKRD